MNPDQMGPIVRNTADGKKQLVHARWGLPSPPLRPGEDDQSQSREARGQG